MLAAAMLVVVGAMLPVGIFASSSSARLSGALGCYSCLRLIAGNAFARQQQGTQANQQRVYDMKLQTFQPHKDTSSGRSLPGSPSLFFKKSDDPLSDQWAPSISSEYPIRLVKVKYLGRIGQAAAGRPGFV